MIELEEILIDGQTAKDCSPETLLDVAEVLRTEGLRRLEEELCALDVRREHLLKQWGESLPTPAAPLPSQPSQPESLAPKLARPVGVPKYRNPGDNKQTWTGRGKKPGWVMSCLNVGKTLADLAIPTRE